MTTLYMVELSFPFPDERAGFDEFYSGHISMLLSIEGFRTAQRFEANGNAVAPFMAVYELDDPQVLSSDGYTSRAGPTSVSETYRPKMLNWDRNLLFGPDLSLNVPPDGWMVLIDRKRDDAPPLPAQFTPFAPVGLDQTVVERGIWTGSGSAPMAPAQRPGWVVRDMRPLHPQRTAPA
ncbi:MAG: hypothetical protein ACI8PT_001949 [Gammaproteobacteria bacterium]|jgi:hypothetical protein